MTASNQKDIVFALDIGVYKTGVNGQVLASTTAGWSRLTQGVVDFKSVRHNGTPTYGQFVNSSNSEESLVCFCGRSIKNLAELMAQDLRTGKRVAIGFEAPMWIPLENSHRANMNLFSPRFSAEQGSEWYLQSGAAATVKAISLGTMLREHLRQLVGTFKWSTTVEDWEPGVVLLFEAFVVGKYKVNNVKASIEAPHEWDAFTAALALGNLYLGFLTPISFRGIQLHLAGARTEPCLSVWDMIFGVGSSSTSSKPDCEVVALEECKN